MGDTLNDYGYGFQTKVIASLLTDRTFTDNIIDILVPDYFDSSSLKWLCKNTLFYFKEYRTVPTLDVFKVQLSNVASESEQVEIKSTLKAVWTNIDSDDLQFVKEQTIEFCKNQVLKAVILKSVDYLKQGKFDNIKTEVDAALKICQGDKNFGHDYLNDIDYRYTDEAEVERIGTGWEVLDDLTGGGLGKGKFGIIMAPTGIGKSWLLCGLGAAALKAGKTVVHYTLELDENYVAKRYDAILTGTPMDDLKYSVNETKRRLKEYKGSVHIKYFPAGTLTFNALESHLDKFIMGGIQPDLVILDYAELMQIDYSANMREDKVLGELYKNLRGLASLKNFALWSGDQTNRGSSTKDIIEGDGISNAYAKLFALDFMMSISRRPKDKVKNTARCFVGKNRMGPDGLTFPMLFDTSTATFEIYNENTDKGKQLTKDMQSDDEYERKQLGNIYQKHITQPKQLF